MNAHHTCLRTMRGCLILLTLAAATAGFATPASAYLLYKTSACSPGQKWDTSHPVKVRLLGDSVFDYLNNRPTGSTLTDLVRLNADVKAVIDLYNSIPGSSLVALQSIRGITATAISGSLRTRTTAPRRL